MEYLGIRIVEHPTLCAEEVWIIHKSDAPQVPLDLRGNFSIPYILTGNASEAQRLLSLVRAIDGQYVNSGASRLLQRFIPAKEKQA